MEKERKKINLDVERWEKMLLLVDTEQSLAVTEEILMRQLFVKGNVFYRSTNEKAQEKKDKYEKRKIYTKYSQDETTTIWLKSV